MRIRSVKDADLKDKIVLIRSDYNIPITDGKIEDDTRIVESLENIKYILSQEPKKIVIISHIGRPADTVVEELRMTPVVEVLSNFVGEDIDYIKKTYEDLKKGDVTKSAKKIVFLENIRFDGREKEGNKKFAEFLASLGDIFVLDGFAVAHRNHASVTKIAEFIPAYAGLTLLQEKVKIDEFLSSIRKPFWGFFGGAKLSGKIPVIKALATKLDGLVFGSSIAIAFLDKFGFGVGDSIISKDSKEAVEDFIEFNKKLKIKVVFPSDLIVGNVRSLEQKSVVSIDMNNVMEGKIDPFVICEPGEAIYDIGESSVDIFENICLSAGTVFWNGPFGFSEKEEFSSGTKFVANMIAKSEALSMAGGGDTIAFINDMEMAHEFDFVSTSGGAMMEYVAFGTLPGLEILVE